MRNTNTRAASLVSGIIKFNYIFSKAQRLIMRIFFNLGAGRKSRAREHRFGTVFFASLGQRLSFQDIVAWKPTRLAALVKGIMNS